MIIKEYFGIRKDGIKLFRNYSDEGVQIRQEQTGILYDEAVDVEGSLYTYVETDIPIESEEIDAEEALQIIIGGVENETE